MHLHPGTPFGAVFGSPRVDGLLVALGIWLAGIALTGATLWRMDRANVDTPRSAAAFTSTPATASEETAKPDESDNDMTGVREPTETAESEGILILPDDFIVGQLRSGVTLQQKP